MLYLEEIEELDLFPSSKYGVKEPPLEVVSGIRKGLKRFAWDDICIDIKIKNKKDLLVQTDNAQERESTFNIDLLVVPGVAFDTNCNRLGHGKGYYDSFIFRNKSLQQQLSKTERSTFIIGVALTEQMIDNVPHDERDMKLDAVINPSGFIRCTSSSS
jgi:5-formyltetrahydrofolate cyclo-ligase